MATKTVLLEAASRSMRFDISSGFVAPRWGKKNWGGVRPPKALPWAGLSWALGPRPCPIEKALDPTRVPGRRFFVLIASWAKGP